MGAPVVWFEVAGRDLETLTNFYGQLFDWKIDASNPMGYGVVDTGADSGIQGGLCTADDGGEYVTFYVSVPDLEASLEHAERLGAKVLQPPTPIPGMRIAYVADPEGQRLGMITYDS